MIGFLISNVSEMVLKTVVICEFLFTCRIASLWIWLAGVVVMPRDTFAVPARPLTYRRCGGVITPAKNLFCKSTEFSTLSANSSCFVVAKYDNRFTTFSSLSWRHCGAIEGIDRIYYQSKGRFSKTFLGTASPNPLSPSSSSMHLLYNICRVSSTMFRPADNGAREAMLKNTSKSLGIEVLCTILNNHYSEIYRPEYDGRASLYSPTQFYLATPMYKGHAQLVDKRIPYTPKKIF